MKKIAVLFLTFIMIMGLVACGGTEDDASNNATENYYINGTEVSKEEYEKYQREQEEYQKQLELAVAEYENMTLELQDATVVTTEEGNKLLKVVATYTNANSEPYYAMCSFGVKAFQNDVELNDVSDINGDEADLIREVKDGTSLEVHYLFELSDDSEVEVLITEPTADAAVIGQKNYTVTE